MLYSSSHARRAVVFFMFWPKVSAIEQSTSTDKISQWELKEKPDSIPSKLQEGKLQRFNPEVNKRIQFR